MDVISHEAAAWGAAVRSLLKAAGIAEVRVAEQVNVQRARLHQLLRGNRRPKPSVVAAVNECAGKLIGLHAQEYFDAVALLHGLLEPDADQFSRLLKSADEVVRSLRDYFVRPDAAVAAIKHARAKGKIDRAGVARLVIALGAMQGKRLLETLQGRPRRKLFLDEVVWLFDHSGVNVDLFLRQGAGAQLRRVRDRFQIAAESMDRPDRVKTLLDAFDEAAREIVQLIQREHMTAAILRGVFAGSLSRPATSPLAVAEAKARRKKPSVTRRKEKP